MASARSSLIHLYIEQTDETEEASHMSMEGGMKSRMPA